MKTKKAIKVLDALAQDTRLGIFRLLIQENELGLSAGKIAEILQVPATTLSFHLSHLENASLIKPRKEGRTIYYAARYKTLKELMKYITENAWHKREKEKANIIIQKQTVPD